MRCSHHTQVRVCGRFKSSQAGGARLDLSTARGRSNTVPRFFFLLLWVRGNGDRGRWRAYSCFNICFSFIYDVRPWSVFPTPPRPSLRLPPVDWLTNGLLVLINPTWAHFLPLHCSNVFAPRHMPWLFFCFYSYEQVHVPVCVCGYKLSGPCVSCFAILSMPSQKTSASGWFRNSLFSDFAQREASSLWHTFQGSPRGSYNAFRRFLEVVKWNFCPLTLLTLRA